MSSIAQRRLVGRIMLGVALVAALGLSLVAMRPIQAQTTTQPGGVTRQPIVQNQFTTTSGGALQARAPGIYVQQGIRVQTGEFDPFTGDAVREPGFIAETVEMLWLQVIDILISIIDSLNLLAGGNPLAGLIPTL